MERVRHARIPVHLNAVLIGEKTVPKGCKVRNVSNQGLLLQCDADGRILTFRDGDHVDIHLLFHRPDGTKYQTIAANVRHVDANGIGVEFCQPDAGLVKLIESYRVDDTQTVEATITHRRKVTGQDRSASVVSIPAPVSSAHAERRRLAEDSNGKRLSYIGLLSLAVAVIIFTAGYLRTFDLVSRVSQLETLIRAHDGELNSSQPRLLGSDNAGGAEAGGSNPPPSAAAPGAGHENRVVVPVRKNAVAMTTTMTAVSQTETPPERRSGGLSAAEAATSASSAERAGLIGQPAPVYEKSQYAEKNGAWVINLMSSPNRSDADRFAENARKQGIAVEQTSVRLNDREFFRVQMTGFVTEKQARESAGPVQERLGLKDVWIFKP